MSLLCDGPCDGCQCFRNSEMMVLQEAHSLVSETQMEANTVQPAHKCKCLKQSGGIPELVAN